MQTVKGVKVRCIKLLKNKVYKFARYISLQYCTKIIMFYPCYGCRTFIPHQQNLTVNQKVFIHHFYKMEFSS